MPSGACVIRYQGSRGVVWRIKYADATGKQVQETLGKGATRMDPGGWTKKKAQRELRDRLHKVEQNGYRKPEPETFRSFVSGWVDEHCDAHGLKTSTRQGYRLIVDGHLLPALGSAKLAEIDVERMKAYVVAKRKAGFAPRTINRHLNLLSLIFASALREGRVNSNPIPLVERPRDPRKRKGWRILAPGEIGRVERAFVELIDAAEDEERAWREQARVIFLVLADTGIRRGEVLGLRWRRVHLADPAGPRIRIDETFTRQRIDTPKSESSERTIELSEPIANELFEHRRRTAFQGEDERVFCSPTKGTPFDVTRYATTLRLALAKAEIEGAVRPFHDIRHTSITNGAAAGMTPAALQQRAGHSDYKTTEGYINLAGVAFPDEAAKHGKRLWGSDTGTKFRYKADPETAAPDEAR